MKKNILKLNSLLIGLFLAGTFAACNSGGGEAEENDVAATDAVNEPVPTPVGITEAEEAGEHEALLEEYMDVKEALVEDEFERVRDEAKDLLELFEASELPEEQLNELREAAGQLVEAGDIAAQRQYFAVLSNTLYELTQTSELTAQTLYWQYCPMAMNNTGANWLSFEKEIQNPYMGQSMPKCGSVAEVIE